MLRFLLDTRCTAFLLVVEIQATNFPVPALPSSAFEWFVVNSRADVALPTQVLYIRKHIAQHIVLRITSITSELFDMQQITRLTVRVFQGSSTRTVLV